MVIAHRLSTVCDSDQILVLESDAIAERGSHEELMSRNGWYSALVSRQIDPVSYRNRGNDGESTDGLSTEIDLESGYGGLK